MTGIIVAIIIVIVVAAIAAWYLRGGRGSARAELRRLDLRSLSPSERDTYLEDSVHVQGSFVDDPAVALDSADTLVGRLLRDIGYPTDDEEKLLRLLSVRYERDVRAYQEARAVHTKSGDGAADVDTETMRIAMNGYNAVFQDLLSTHSAPADTVERVHETEGAS